MGVTKKKAFKRRLEAFSLPRLPRTSMSIESHVAQAKFVPCGVRLPKTPANELKPNLFEFLQRVQQCFNKVKGNIVMSQLFCLQNDRGNHWVIVTQSVGRSRCDSDWLNGSCPQGKQKITNYLQPLQHLIMLGRLLFTYTLHRTQERGIQRGYIIAQTRLLCTKHSETNKR